MFYPQKTSFVVLMPIVKKTIYVCPYKIKGTDMTGSVNRLNFWKKFLIRNTYRSSLCQHKNVTTVCYIAIAVDVSSFSIMSSTSKVKLYKTTNPKNRTELVLFCSFCLFVLEIRNKGHSTGWFNRRNINCINCRGGSLMTIAVTVLPYALLHEMLTNRNFVKLYRNQRETFHGFGWVFFLPQQHSTDHKQPKMYL